MYNIGSLIFGLISWIIPFRSINKEQINVEMRVLYSSSFCILSLLFQLFEINARVNIGDFSSLMDTSRAIIIVASILVTVCISLNLILLKSREEEERISD